MFALLPYCSKKNYWRWQSFSIIHTIYTSCFTFEKYQFEYLSLLHLSYSHQYTLLKLRINYEQTNSSIYFFYHYKDVHYSCWKKWWLFKLILHFQRWLMRLYELSYLLCYSLLWLALSLLKLLSLNSLNSWLPVGYHVCYNEYINTFV